MATFAIKRAWPVLEIEAIWMVMRSPGRTPDEPGSGSEFANSPVDVAASVGLPAVLTAQIDVPLSRTSPTVLSPPVPAVTAKNLISVILPKDTHTHSVSTRAALTAALE